ncbi:MAG: M23 family metallopeptidase [Clostridia bacterium]|nr:M23 family metallopeptidase [Clostridia bacterium]
MKNKKSAGILSKKFFGKFILLASAAAITVSSLASCTVDEALTVADSLARRYYLEESAEPTQATETAPTEASTQTPTSEPVVQIEPDPTSADEPVEQPYYVSFAMPFLDKAHGGVDYRVTQSFSSTHGGLDIGVYWGTPILAATDGKVVYAYNDGDISSTSGDLRWTYGTFVVIESYDGVYRTYYAHMSRKAVNVGDVVKQGDTVGYSGNTGRVSSSSSGPYAGTHLHFEVRVWNGSSFIKQDPKLYLPWWN